MRMASVLGPLPESSAPSAAAIPAGLWAGDPRRRSAHELALARLPGPWIPWKNVPRPKASR
jgi:hypothetical protein